MQTLPPQLFLDDTGNVRKDIEKEEVSEEVSD